MHGLDLQMFFASLVATEDNVVWYPAKEERNNRELPYENSQNVG